MDHSTTDFHSGMVRCLLGDCHSAMDHGALAVNSMHIGRFGGGYRRSLRDCLLRSLQKRVMQLETTEKIEANKNVASWVTT